MEDSGPAYSGPAYVRTFLIADIRGYTSFTVEHGDEAAARLASVFARLTRDAVAAHGGQLLELRGDEALSVFTSARQALRAAVDLQRSYVEEMRLDPTVALNVGIGVDAGECLPVEGGFRGAALNLAARLCSAAAAGEVLASAGVIHLAGRLDGLTYRERGPLALKGFPQPIEVLTVTDADAAPAGEPLNPDAAPAEELPRGGFLGAVPEGSLVGREGELSRIDAQLEVAAGGAGRLLMLAGEPGIGKTRIAQEATLRARALGFATAFGRCYESQQSVPYYPFLDALSTVYRASPAGVRSQIAQRWPLLPRLIPAAGSSPSGSQFGSQDEQQRLFWSVTEFLRQMAEERPLALFLDDLQWADSSSIELLQHVARHTRSSAIYLLGTYRDVDVGRDHLLQRAMLELAREHLLERVTVASLDANDTASLVADRVGSEVAASFASAIHERTDGNPFFTEEIVRSLLERGEVRPEEAQPDARDVEIPETVRATISQRLIRLADTTQDILRSACVLGQTFLFEDLQEMHGAAETEVDEALREAVTAGLLREMDEDRYTFGHALARETLYGDLSPRRRRLLHRRAGETLERLPERVRERRAGELASHFTSGGDPVRALPYAVMVGDRAASAFAHDEAETYYREALRLAGDAEDSPRRAEIAEKLGGLLTAMIRYPPALIVLEEAAAAYRQIGDTESEGRVVAQIGRVHLSRASGPPLDGIERLAGYLAGGGDARAGTRAALQSVLGKLLVAAERYDEARTESLAAAAVAEEVGDGGVRAESMITAGVSMVALGDLGGGEALLHDSIEVAEAAGDLFSICRALQYLASVVQEHGRLDDSASLVERARDLAVQMNNRRQIASTGFALSHLAFLRGDWLRSKELAAGATATMRELAGSWEPSFQMVGIAALEAAEGRTHEARAILEECLQRSAGSDGVIVRRAQVELARLDLLDGEPRRAADRLAALNESELPWRAPLAHSVLVPTVDVPATLAAAQVALGDLDPAEELLAASLARARGQKMELSLVNLLRVQAALKAAQGERVEAARCLDEARERALAAGYHAGESQVRQEPSALSSGSDASVVS